MAKNLKDIVDEGFAKLALLADKRMEILKRSEQIASTAGAPQIEFASQKMAAAEVGFRAEINTQLDSLLEDLRQTLVQVAENNQIFLVSVKENLRLRIAKILRELEQTQDYALSGTSEKLGSLILQSEKDFEANRSDLRSESVMLLGDLESLCKRSQSWLHQSQAEIAGKIASSEYELTALLGESFGSLVQQAEERRRQVSESLEEFYRKQDEQMSAATEELNEKTSLAVSKSLSSMEKLCVDSEQKLKAAQDETIKAATSELKSLTHDSLSELVDSCDYSKQELSEKLAEAQELSLQLNAQIKKVLSERESNIKAQAESVYLELKNSGEETLGIVVRSPVDLAFAAVTDEFGTMQSNLKRKIDDLLKVQAESIASLSAASERTFAELVADSKTQIVEMAKTQDALAEQKEAELLQRLEKLAKQISDTYSMLEGINSGDNSNGGGAQ